MKTLRLFAVVASLFLAAPAVHAQWATPNHSVPLGRGLGVTGFGSAAPGTAGMPFVSNGASSDPTFQALQNGGLATVPANTVKCNPTGAQAAVQDCTLAQLGTPSLSANNVWPGVQTFAGDAYFKSGRPWADVRAWGALCNSSANDTSAIQNAINTVDALNGGEVFFSPGNCLVSASLTVAQATCLVGTGGSPNGASSITNNGSDFIVVRFAAGKNGACLRNITIFGFTNTAATQPVVLVGHNSAVHMSTCTIWGGSFALSTDGADGRIYNCYFSGWAPGGGGVTSTGANFWTANKIDQSTVPTSVGFFQGVPSALAENHFTDNDFSGTYSIASFDSDDGGALANVNIHVGSVFSSAVVLTHSKFTSLVGAEIGGAVSSGVGPLSITGSFGFAGVTATGAATRSCAGNINVTC